MLTSSPHLINRIVLAYPLAAGGLLLVFLEIGLVFCEFHFTPFLSRWRRGDLVESVDKLVKRLKTVLCQAITRLYINKRLKLEDGPLGSHDAKQYS